MKMSNKQFMFQFVLIVLGAAAGNWISNRIEDKYYSQQ